MKKRKTKRKVFALVAVAAAVSAVVLGACAKKKADENSEAEGAADEQPSEASAVSQEAKEELTTLLDRIQREVQPGTAGCSLKAANVAVAFLKWGERNPMSAADAKAITEEFITSQAGEYFSESVVLVDEACADLRGAEALGVLEDIGMNLMDKTWGNEPLPLVEAVMEAAGQR